MGPGNGAVGEVFWPVLVGRCQQRLLGQAVGLAVVLGDLVRIRQGISECGAGAAGTVVEELLNVGRVEQLVGANG
ncbi:hypothetical protein GCM10010254_64320 [Streptomyces chromofuscus]|nr:hypothetical protein GCM10010254_64320 [Streptomyces chromofuscus]